MKIKDYKKFIRSISLILFLTLLLITIFNNNKVLSHREVSYRKIHIISGDTLWSIAKEEQENNSYYSGKDIRQVIDNIKLINNLETNNLKVGQELLLIK